MTINKSQGQSFKKIGIYLPHHVFTHGQLYVALSRVGAAEDICLFIDKIGDHVRIKKDNVYTDAYTRNIVFQEVFKKIALG